MEGHGKRKRFLLPGSSVLKLVSSGSTNSFSSAQFLEWPVTPNGQLLLLALPSLGSSVRKVPLPPAAFEASPASSNCCTRGFCSMRFLQRSQVLQHQSPAEHGGQQLPAGSHFPIPSSGSFLVECLCYDTSHKKPFLASLRAYFQQVPLAQ